MTTDALTVASDTLATHWQPKPVQSTPEIVQSTSQVVQSTPQVIQRTSGQEVTRHP